MSIRVVLADDVALFREGLAQLVARAEGLELVGTASDLPLGARPRRAGAAGCGGD